MGGDMRDTGSHLGATAVPVSLRQRAVDLVGGWGILVAKMLDGDVGDGQGRG